MKNKSELPDDLLIEIEAPNKDLERKWKRLHGIDDLRQSILEYCKICLDGKRIRLWCISNYSNPHRVMKLLTDEINFSGKILFVGDPGTGKTELAEGLAYALGKEFGKLYLIKPLVLRSKYVGLSSQRLRKLFEYAREKAKECPVILLFDEFDSVAPMRDNAQMHEEIKAFVNTLLEEIEKVTPSDRILVIGTTNLERAVDFAADRRFEVIVFFKRPNYAQRFELIKILLEPFEIDTKTIEGLARRTNGYTQADIKKLIKQALLIALNQNRRLEAGDLFKALKEVKPTRSYSKRK